MYNIQEYIDNKYYEFTINEGGMGGHMSHPIDYDDLTFKELDDMIEQLFDGKIENVKEKLDGTNIQATVNKDGEVVFIRNKGDLNSDKGGMTVDDMAKKWADKPSVAKNYVKAGEVIEKIFSKIPNSYFNPDDETKVVVNCECISAGQTNVMLYEKDRVAFHGTATYKLNNGKWQLESESEGEPKEIRKAAEGIKEALPRPALVIKNTEEAKKVSSEARKQLTEMMNSYHMKSDSTILDWKRTRYDELAPLWARNDECFNRLVQQDKSVNMRELKKKYPDIQDFEKSQAKDLYRDIMEPLDTLFSQIGNALIGLLDGFTNADDSDKVIAALKDELEKDKEYIEKEGTDEMKDVMARSLQRLAKLDNKLNAAEGVVFQYNGKLMKMTGAFSALNQLLGIKFMK